MSAVVRRAVPLVLVAALVSPELPTAAAAPCAPAPAYDPAVTPPRDAIPNYPDVRATSDQIIEYFKLVGEQSGRADTGVYGESIGGSDLVYSIATSERNLGNLDEIVARHRRLRDPRRTSLRAARNLSRSTPAIVWYTGNVHGNETSGADAAIEVLYELAARTDCAADEMRRKLVVGIIPTQNPDGRDSASRTNAYSFDMNRDWFAWTQPETDSKVALLERFPMVLFIDAHEMASSDYFFPPNADPIHHEISPQAVHWINNVYGAAMAAEFERRKAEDDPANWDYFNYNVYDLFYMGYGDTVPTTAFTAAGMTFEKGIADPDRQRWLEQFVAGWTSLEQAARRKSTILRQYYEAHVTAWREGIRGELEPNQIIEPDNTLQRRVPSLTIRNYFINPFQNRSDVARVIDRLLRMGVEVYRLKEDVTVPDLQDYGRGRRRGTVRRGSYWIPMDQPQKRWIQALLGEDSYVPFPYFYDVTAWSNPLLMNLNASFSGEKVRPSAARVRSAERGALLGRAGRGGFFWFAGDTGNAVAAALWLDRQGLEVRRTTRLLRVRGQNLPAGSVVVAPAPGARTRVVTATRDFVLRARAVDAGAPRGHPVEQPKIALYAPPGAGESLGHLRYLLDRRWEVPYTEVTGAQVAAGELQLGDYDVFIVPGVSTSDLTLAQEQIRAWIQEGGIYVGTTRGGSGGTPYAVASGYTSSTRESGDMQIPGTMFRVRVGGGTPVTLGGQRFAYWFHLGESALTPSTTGVNAVRYPASEPAFWYSGYAEGQDALKGTAGLVDESLGDGRVVLFSNEPNYRAYTEGSQFFLANAIAYPIGEGPSSTDVASPAAAPAVAAARAQAAPQFGPGRPISIRVALGDTETALEVVRRFTTETTVETRGRWASIRVPNPEGLDREAHPFIWRLVPALREAGVRVISAIL